MGMDPWDIQEEVCEKENREESEKVGCGEKGHQDDEEMMFAESKAEYAKGGEKGNQDEEAMMVAKSMAKTETAVEKQEVEEDIVCVSSTDDENIKTKGKEQRRNKDKTMERKINQENIDMEDDNLKR